MLPYRRATPQPPGHGFRTARSFPNQDCGGMLRRASLAPRGEAFRIILAEGVLVGPTHS